MNPRTFPVLLPLVGALAACRGDTLLNKVVEEPLTLTVLTPAYGAYLGLAESPDAPLSIEVSGLVSPTNAQVLVNGVHAEVHDDGTFTATVPWAADPDSADSYVPAATDRAYVLDVQAWDPDESARQLVPVFDGNDPRDTDPGAIAGLLTPTGLDALEPTVADTVDALGLWEQLGAALPTVDTTYLDITPTGITSSGTSADLAPADSAVTLLLTFHDVVMTADIGVLDSYTLPVSIGLGEVTLGADAVPGLSDTDMLTLALTDAQADITDVSLSFGDYDVPEWLTQLLVDPIAGLVADLGGGLASLVLDQLGTVELGGPFAFSTDLLGTTVSARLAEVDAGLDGVALGVTVSTDGDAAEDMPELSPLSAQTPAGRDYQLGFGLHEGLLNTLIDQTVAGFLDIDLELEGDYGELLGAGIAALPGGYAIPDDHEGYCIGVHAGDARVVRFAEGTGAPMAQLWLPDMRVDLQTIQDGDCTDWLSASVLAVADIDVRGTTLDLGLDVRHATVLSYRAYDEDPSIDLNAVGDQLGTVVEGFAALALSQASFDLADMLGGFGGLGVTLDPELISVEPLGEEGRYGVFLDVF